MQDESKKDIDVEEIAEEIVEDLNKAANEGMLNEDTEEEKKNLFGKNKKDKKDKKDLQIEELNDKLKRSMAEFDNFRKRTDKEKSYMYEIGAKEVIEKILPVVDNFERGLAIELKDSEMPAFAEGMDKIYKQLCTTLEDIGVKPIEAVGNEFDPSFHNAVMHGEDEELGENIVAEEYRKGYLYKDSVVRHSMVRVV
ncbi:MAG: nucleotide exchange factor GrpE, partial [Clostridiales bacterium]|nr:nucleotide exchange factor GrpE [Clostridiales bacterium]